MERGIISLLWVRESPTKEAVGAESYGVPDQVVAHANACALRFDLIERVAHLAQQSLG